MGVHEVKVQLRAFRNRCMTQNTVIHGPLRRRERPVESVRTRGGAMGYSEGPRRGKPGAIQAPHRDSRVKECGSTDDGGSSRHRSVYMLDARLLHGSPSRSVEPASRPDPALAAHGSTAARDRVHVPRAGRSIAAPGHSLSDDDRWRTELTGQACATDPTLATAAPRHRQVPSQRSRQAMWSSAHS